MNRSASAGEEFTPYNPQNNAVEAQYSSAVVEQRTKERLSAWANVFGENVRKLMWVGHTEKAYIDYAGELGMGSRQGFVEMYNGFVDMPQFGFTINSDRYVDVDEENLFIKNNPAFGDENEAYTNELRFGWKESFPYRYYVSSFRMLQQRRNYVMHASNTLNRELTWYVGLGLSRKVENTSDAFSMLSEYYLSPWANNGKDVLIDGGKDKILHLEFVNGAGFEIDAIEFVESAIPVTGVTISSCPPEALNIDSTYQLMATITPSNADDLRVTWSSSNENIATVDENGLVTALSAGETTITVTTTDGYFTSDCVVAVVDTTTTNSSKIELSRNGIKVYPNPVSEILYFSFPHINAERRIRIFNAVGQKIYSDNAIDLHKSIEIENLKANGIIFVQVITGQNVSTFKIIIKKEN